MAFNLTKAQIAEIATLAGKLREQAEAIEDAVNVVNDQIVDLVETQVTAKVNAYNDTLSEAKELIGEIASHFRGAFDDKSEKWQQGEVGVEVDSFIQQFEDADLNDVTPPQPDPLSVDVDDDAGTLEGLPESI